MGGKLYRFFVVIIVFGVLFIFVAVYFGGFGGRSLDGFRKKIDGYLIQSFNSNTLGFRSVVRFFFPEFRSWESPWYLHGEVQGEPLYGIMGALLEYQRDSGVIIMRRYNGMRVKIYANSSPIVIKKSKREGDFVVDSGVGYYGSVGEDVKLCLGDRLEVFTKNPSFFGDINSDGIIFIGPTACGNEN